MNEDALVEDPLVADDAAPAPSPTELDEKEALRQSIERNEAELRDAVEELTAVVKNEVSLAGQIADRPALWLAGGFTVGLLLALRR